MFECLPPPTLFARLEEYNSSRQTRTRENHRTSAIALTMHRCLVVDEIVRNVAFCEDVLRGASLLNMALTCKAFYEPAMDALWEKMGPDLKPILLLLPSQCVGRTEPSSSLKVPDDAESDRVWHYAKRVRYWTVDDLRLFNYQIRSNEAFTGLASPFLFPYLRQLNVKEVTSRTISPTLLMPPSLQNVQLQWVYPEDLSILPFVRQLFACQSLRTLTLIGGAGSRGSSSPVMEDAFADSLLRLRMLEVVRVDWLSLQPRALAHLASLEHLQDLTFWVKGSEGLFDGPSYTNNAFQALERLSLSVTARNSDGILSLLHGLPKVQQLRELSVRLDSCANSTSSMNQGQWPSCEPTTSGAPSQRYMKRLTMAIAAAQFPSLQVLKIIVYTLSRDFELIFSESCLSSLLSLRGLTELDIGECTIYHIPDFFRIVASTWPCLQVLNVGGPAEDVSPFGVADLLPLVDCRELHTLGVYLNEQVSSADVARRPPPGTSQSPLRAIHLRSEVEDVENFALFLHSAFPLADVRDRAYGKMTRKISINQELARLRAANEADAQGANEKGSI